MNVIELIRTLNECGVRVWVEGGSLRCVAPAGAMTNLLQDELRSKKKELVELLKDRQRPPSENNHLQIPVLDRDKAHPLSPAQKRIWMMNRMGVGSYVYHFLGKMEFEGNFSPQHWLKGIEFVVKRHDALRTSFIEDGEEPLQLVNRAASASMPIIDLSELSSDERESLISRKTEEMIVKPFDLAAPPLIRCCLIKNSEHKFIFLIAIHHIISDGWSVGNLMRDMLFFYRKNRLGEAISLPDLKVQYLDYSSWQNQRLATDGFEREATYWKNRLEGAPPLVSFPGDRARPAVETFRGESFRFSLSDKQTKLVREMAKSQAATVFIVMVAIFKALIYAYTGSRDIVIGTIVANRQRRELEDLVGIFINTLALRSQIDPNKPFVSLLADLKNTIFEAYEMQEIPFEKLVELLRPDRYSSQNPIFQIMILLQNAPMPAIELTDLRIKVDEIGTASAPFDIIMTLADEGEQLIGSLRYNIDLFDAETISQIVERYKRLVELLLLEPSVPIREISLSTMEEISSGASGFNESPAVYSPPPIYKSFEKVAATRPDSIAIVDPSGCYTYKYVNERSNQLAAFLRSRGVRGEKTIGICTDRSAALVIAMLAVLKAGGTYVPLDPETPGERLSYILENGGVAFVLTDVKTRQRLPTSEEFSYLCLDELEEKINGEGKGNLCEPVVAANLAYVIFTSGSTGSPKGVGVSHQNVICLLAAAARDFEFEKDDIWSLFHSAAFDFSVWEIWGALINGARLVMVPFETTRNPVAFGHLICREQVSILNQTPTAFSIISRSILDHQMSTDSLRYVIMAGEKLQTKILREWIKKFGDKSPVLVNMYGITETTVHVTFHKVTEVECEAQNEGRSYIGRPLNDLRVYLLNEHGLPIPPGIEGEICVAGDGVARGYINSARETARRFTPNPLGNDVRWNRLYRSGDICKLVDDQKLIYIGRRDNQRKIRGFRIELDEIGQTISSFGGIAATATLIASSEEDDFIVAYYVKKLNASVTVEDLQLFMREKLPIYMLPRYLVQLDEMPLTLNGKLDVGRLPGKDHWKNDSKESAKPETPMQQRLGEIWSKVLDLQSIGIDHNFFTVGGHSLTAIRLINEIKRETGYEMTMPKCFQYPTIRLMAELIETNTGVTAGTENSMSRDGKFSGYI